MLTILNVHYGEIRHHPSLLHSLHTMVASLQLDVSAHGAENQLAIVDLQFVVQDLHTHLAIFNSGSKSFARRHVKEAMNYISSTLKYQMPQVSNTVLYLKKEAIYCVVASWYASHEDDHLP